MHAHTRIYVCVCAQSCLALYGPMDCSLPGSCVLGILQAKYLNGLPFPIPGDFPDPGMEPIPLLSPELGRGRSSVLCVLSQVQLFATLGTVAHQAPLFMGLSRQEGHFLLQGIFQTQGRNPISCISCTGRQILYNCAMWEA